MRLNFNIFFSKNNKKKSSLSFIFVFLLISLFLLFFISITHQNVFFVKKTLPVKRNSYERNLKKENTEEKNPENHPKKRKKRDTALDLLAQRNKEKERFKAQAEKRKKTLELIADAQKKTANNFYDINKPKINEVLTWLKDDNRLANIKTHKIREIKNNRGEKATLDLSELQDSDTYETLELKEKTSLFTLSGITNAQIQIDALIQAAKDKIKIDPVLEWLKAANRLDDIAKYNIASKTVADDDGDDVDLNKLASITAQSTYESLSKEEKDLLLTLSGISDAKLQIDVLIKEAKEAEKINQVLTWLNDRNRLINIQRHKIREINDGAGGKTALSDLSDLQPIDIYDVLEPAEKDLLLTLSKISDAKEQIDQLISNAQRDYLIKKTKIEEILKRLKKENSSTNDNDEIREITDKSTYDSLTPAQRTLLVNASDFLKKLESKGGSPVLTTIYGIRLLKFTNEKFLIYDSNNDGDLKRYDITHLKNYGSDKYRNRSKKLNTVSKALLSEITNLLKNNIDASILITELEKARVKWFLYYLHNDRLLLKKFIWFSELTQKTIEEIADKEKRGIYTGDIVIPKIINPGAYSGKSRMFLPKNFDLKKLLDVSEDNILNTMSENEKKYLIKWLTIAYFYFLNLPQLENDINHSIFAAAKNDAYFKSLCKEGVDLNLSQLKTEKLIISDKEFSIFHLKSKIDSCLDFYQDKAAYELKWNGISWWDREENKNTSDELFLFLLEDLTLSDFSTAIKEQFLFEELEPLFLAFKQNKEMLKNIFNLGVERIQIKNLKYEVLALFKFDYVKNPDLYPIYKNNSHSVFIEELKSLTEDKVTWNEIEAVLKQIEYWWRIQVLTNAFWSDIFLKKEKALNNWFLTFSKVSINGVEYDLEILYKESFDFQIDHKKTDLIGKDPIFSLLSSLNTELSEGRTLSLFSVLSLLSDLVSNDISFKDIENKINELIKDRALSFVKKLQNKVLSEKLFNFIQILALKSIKIKNKEYFFDQLSSFDAKKEDVYNTSFSKTKNQIESFIKDNISIEEIIAELSILIKERRQILINVFRKKDGFLNVLKRDKKKVFFIGKERIKVKELLKTNWNKNNNQNTSQLEPKAEQELRKLYRFVNKKEGVSRIDESLKKSSKNDKIHWIFSLVIVLSSFAFCILVVSLILFSRKFSLFSFNEKNKQKN